MSEKKRESASRAAAEEVGDYADTTVAVLLTVAAVIAALIGIRAAVLGDSGSDTWHAAVRQDVKRDAAIVEVSRFIYQEEAPLALQVAAERFQGEEVRKEENFKSGTVRDLLDADASMRDRLALLNEKGSEVARDKRYATDEGGFDIIRRLGDRRQKDQDLVRLDPDATERRASGDIKEASLLIATTIPVALGFLCGALAEAFEPRRRILVRVGYVLVGLGLVLAIFIEVTN